jgi:chromosome segregation ATPase
MADEPINLVLEHLRAIRAKLDEHDERFNDVVHRLTRIEIVNAGLRREQAGDAENVAHLGARLDRLGEEIDRIKRRLELID